MLDADYDNLIFFILGLKVSATSIRSVTDGVPDVRVPVLSKTTVVMLFILSNISPPLIKIPNEAAIPVPTITAVGVAKPRAHGQAITRVEIPKLKANTNLDLLPMNSFSLPRSEYANANQKIHVKIANTTIVGTKNLAILSATP